MDSERARSAEFGESEPEGTGYPAHRSRRDSSTHETSLPGPVEARVDDALERVAHGATVSISAILLNQGLGFGFTVVLTNGFGAASYGFFVLADRLHGFLVGLVAGFNSGLSRFLPDASSAERDLLATFASLFLLGVATVFGAGLFASVPILTQLAGHGPQFALFVRIFALGLPATVWLRTVAAILRGLEAVGPFNLTLRIGVPTAHLVVGLLGTFVFQSLVVVVVGVLLATGVGGIAAAAWLIRKRGLRPRLRGVAASRIRRRYVRFTLPLFGGGIATTTQRLGFYPLIALLLSGVAGGVFAIGILVGSLVRMPLIGVNQFIPPVAAALHENDHRIALRRLYQLTSRVVVVGVTGLAVPLVVYRTAVMGLFGPGFVEYAYLLPVFVAATYADSAVGSVGILLKMTDNQWPWLVVNVASAAVLVVTAVPLTLTFGLPGLVVSYLLVVVANNSLEVATLYRFEGIQPFTRLHLKPVVGAVPFVLVTVAARMALPALVGPVVGTLVGVTVYAVTLDVLGFTRLERRLVSSLAARYRETARGAPDLLPSGRIERGLDHVAIAIGLLALVIGFLEAVWAVHRLSIGRPWSILPAIGLVVVLGGTVVLVGGLLETVPTRYRLRDLVSVLLGVGLVVLGTALIVFVTLPALR